jgi:hypothetical protein
LEELDTYFAEREEPPKIRKMERKGVHQVFARNSIPLTKRKNKKERKKFLVYILATKKTRCFHSLSTGDVSGRSPPESATNSSLGKKEKNLLIHFLLFFHRFLYTQKKGKTSFAFR